MSTMQADPSSAELTPAAARARVRRAAHRHGALLFVVGLLSLLLVVVNPQRADALAPMPVVLPGVPIAMGATGAGGAGVTSTCAAAAPVCLGVATAVVLGWAAWETRDTWVPVVQDAFGGALNKLGLGGSGCAVSLTGALSGGNIVGNFSWSGCSTAGGWSVNQLQIQHAMCRVGSSVANYAGQANIEAGGPVRVASGSVNLNKAICGAGAGALVYFRGYICLSQCTAPRGKSPERVIGEAVDPSLVNQTSTVDCVVPQFPAGDPQRIQTITSTTVGQGGQVQIPSCSAHFGSGSYPVGNIGIKGGWPGAEQDVGTINLPANPAELYPNCFSPDGGYLGTCRIRVWVNGQPCQIGMNICTNWETYKNDNPGADVDCQWGPYKVDMGLCAPLKRQYRPDASTTTITETNTDGTPKTQPEVKVVSTLPDWITTLLQPLCLTNCTPPPVPDPVDPETPPDKGSCMSEAVSFNPVKWVYVPVKCVLTWAFVPSSSAWSSIVGTLNSAWQDSTPGIWVDSVTSVLPSGSVSGCQGPPLNLDFFGVHVNSNPFSACSGAMATAASVVKAALSLGCVIGGFFGCLRALGAGLGWSVPVGRGGD